MEGRPKPVIALLADEPERPGKSALTLGILAAVTSGLFILSFVRGAQWSERLASQGEEAQLRVAVLQPNIHQDTKLASYLHPDEPRHRAVRRH